MLQPTLLPLQSRQRIPPEKASSRLARLSARCCQAANRLPYIGEEDFAAAFLECAAVDIATLKSNRAPR
jgi:hypothetical protein